MRAASYARVSKKDQQTLPMQTEKIKRYIEDRGWKLVRDLQETASGAKPRPKREELLKSARRREIDVIVVWKLDRWGRSVLDLITTFNELQEIGVGFVSITEALDFTTAAGKAMAGLLSVFAEFERSLLRERVCAGLEQAKQKGTVLGRPKTAISKTEEVRKFWREKISKSEIAKRLKIHRRSVGRIIKTFDD